MPCHHDLDVCGGRLSLAVCYEVSEFGNFKLLIFTASVCVPSFVRSGLSFGDLLSEFCLVASSVAPRAALFALVPEADERSIYRECVLHCEGSVQVL